jgi:probable F420-dependent oxidoreductase
MKLSVATPIVTMLPSTHGSWEEDGSIEDVARIAVAAERLGYHHMTCSEHIGVPADQAARRGARYWDPLATFGFVAARTERIRLATNVLVLGYHHPLELAKRYGTLDKVSGGRVILGVGVGTLQEEFDLLGAPFEDRGARADDALEALRVSLSKREPSYHGEFLSFGGLIIDPCAVQERMPIWIGGRTLRSLRRATTLADGWCPFNVTLPQAHEWLGRVDLPGDFEVVLGPSRPFDPIGDPDGTDSQLVELAGVGATIASAWVQHNSLAHYLEQLEALAQARDRVEADPA